MLTASMLQPTNELDANLMNGIDDDTWYTEWRARELSRVDRSGVCYTDYTGAALAPESLLRDDCNRLLREVMGNPHSEHAASRLSTQALDTARGELLRWMHADPAEYTVVFTANASAACRLVGEGFPFTRRGTFASTADNHNSINGIREFARIKGAHCCTVPVQSDMRLPLNAYELLRAYETGDASLFAFPAQSNFSGVRHPLELVGEAQEAGFRVLLDAAAYLPTAQLRLDRVHPDFVALSLYKMIGYPAGVGALVARHEALAELQRPWFAGGTVAWVSVANERHLLQRGASGFEDGTPAFSAIAAVPAALAALRAAEPVRLARHLRTLTSLLLRELRELKYADGSPAIVVYGPDTINDRGATVAFNVRAQSRDIVPYVQVEERARTANLALRGGCFCNPGCAEVAFGFLAERTRECLLALGNDFTIPRFSECLAEVPVGALRISLGLGSVQQDVRRTVNFLRTYCQLPQDELNTN